VAEVKWTELQSKSGIPSGYEFDSRWTIVKGETVAGCIIANDRWVKLQSNNEIPSGTIVEIVCALTNS